MYQLICIRWHFTAMRIYYNTQNYSKVVIGIFCCLYVYVYLHTPKQFDIYIHPSDDTNRIAGVRWAAIWNKKGRTELQNIHNVTLATLLGVSGFEAENSSHRSSLHIAVARIIATYAIQLKAAKVAEIGCGPGGMAAILKQSYPAPFLNEIDYLCVDLSQSLLALGHAFFNQTQKLYGRPPIFKLGTMTSDFKQLNTTYDVVFINSVLQYLTNPAELSEVVQGLHRLARLGGVIIIADVQDARFKVQAMKDRMVNYSKHQTKLVKDGQHDTRSFFFPH